MLTRWLATWTVTLAILPPGSFAVPLRADDETAEQRFERLLAPALLEPGKAHWKKLGAAFAGTAAHEPYNTEITRELRQVVGRIGKVDAKESEAALRKIVEHERYMRLDSVFLLMRFYDQHDQPEPAAKLKKIVATIIAVLDYPRGPRAWRKPSPSSPSTRSTCSSAVPSPRGSGTSCRRATTSTSR